jgi:hypothetical protein
MEIKTAKEIASTIFECGLAPHSDITEEWIEEKIISLIKMHCQAQQTMNEMGLAYPLDKIK